MEGGGFGGFKPPTPPEIPKFWQSRKGLEIERKMFKCYYFNTLISLKIAEFRTSTPQDIRKKGSDILKLPGSQLFYICNDK